MKLIITLYRIALADFLERVRRTSFWVTLLVIVAVTYFFLPALDAELYPYFNLGGYRPIYNSAWIGVATALLMAEFFPLFGFYLVKNTIERDRRTGVGEIIATTPIRKATYLFGKWISNLAVFITILLVTILAALVLQLIRAEDLHVNLWALVAPFLLINLPEMAIMAALAVLFESITWLRGGFGNVIYYLVYGFLATVSDLQGVQTVWPSVYQACSAHFERCNPNRQLDIDAFPLATLPTFEFTGVTWVQEAILARLSWLLISIGITWLAAIFFHRFDPARIGAGLFEQVRRGLLGFITQPRSETQPDETTADSSRPTSQPIHLSPLAAGNCSWGAKLFLDLFAAELRLNLKGLSWFWFGVALAIIVAGVVVPLDYARLIVLPLAWVWPVLIWANLGVREMAYHTNPIVFSAPFPLRRQFLSTWLVGFTITMAMGSPVLVRLLLIGNLSAFWSILVGALFIPSLALALGCWSSNSKLFQAIYLFIWYLASIQGVSFLDFMGHLPTIETTGLVWVYLILTITLLTAAVFGRKQQLHQR